MDRKQLFRVLVGVMLFLVVLPACGQSGASIQSGEWKGTGDQTFLISFKVAENSGTLIAYSVTYPEVCTKPGGFTGRFASTANVPVSGNQFELTGTDYRVTGKFVAPDRAEGTWQVDAHRSPQFGDCRATNGTWSATPEGGKSQAVAVASTPVVTPTPVPPTATSTPGLPGASGAPVEYITTPGPGINVSGVYAVSDLKQIDEGTTLPQRFPSGTTELYFVIAFSSPPPDGTRVGWEVYGLAGSVQLKGGYVTTREARTGKTRITVGPPAIALADGPYQAKVKINDTVIAVLNWTIGGASAMAMATGTPMPIAISQPTVTTVAVAKKVVIPAVVGQSPERASALLREANLRAQRVEEPGEACTPNVIRQEPAMGAEVEADTIVKIFVCVGPTPTPVPLATSRPTPAPEAEPFYLKPFCQCSESVPTDKSPVLRWAWVATKAESTKDFVTANQTTVTIDGKVYPGLNAYWSEPEYRAKENGYGSVWAYPLPALSPGTHRIETRVVLNRKVTDGYDEDKNGKEDEYGPGEVFSGWVDVQIALAASQPTPATCPNGAPSNTWTLKVVNKTNQPQNFTVDGQVYTVAAGSTMPINLSLNVAHPVKVGNNTMNMSNNVPCGENTLNIN